jgi:N-acetylglucosamine repressor
MPDVVQRGSKGLIRDINNSRVLTLIQAHGPISRTNIAKAAELPPPTVTQIVNEFIAAGLVREDRVGPSVLGRPPILLALNERAAFAVGVKLTSAGLTVAVTDLAGNIVQLTEGTLPLHGVEEVLDQVASEVRFALGEGGIDSGVVLGLGIGMPGLIDYTQGICLYAQTLGWSDVDVKSGLERRLDLPVYVDNDVNMLTAAEIAFGAGQEISEFLTVTTGRGIGLGIVLRNEIYRGAYGGSGELGHIKIDSQLACECGSMGCLETVASEVGICKQAASILQSPFIRIEEVVARANSGDVRLQEIFAHGGRELGRGIGNLINIFNPQRVFVTGEGTRMGDLLLKPMREAAMSATFSRLGDEVRLEIQEWGDEAWAQGAASIVMHEMLKPPIYESEAIRPLNRILDRGSRETVGRTSRTAPFQS